MVKPFMTFTEQRKILHKINNYFRFRYYHRLDYISVHPPLLDGSSVASSVGHYTDLAWKWAELPILFFYLVYLVILKSPTLWRHPSSNETICGKVQKNWINSSGRNAAANFSDYCGMSKHSQIAVAWGIYSVLLHFCYVMHYLSVPVLSSTEFSL